MLTTEQTLDAYHENQEHFEQMNGKETEKNELIYHLRQMHRLLYILVSENKNKKWYEKRK